MLSYRCFIVYFPMSKPSSTISSAVSIRVSNELLNAVREYAIAHNLINLSGRPDKRGEPNLSQAFSELAKLGLGQEITVSDSVSNADDLRDTVKKLSDTVSILSDKLEESEAAIAMLRDELQSEIIEAKHQMRLMLIQATTAAVDVPYFGVVDNESVSSEAVVPANFTQALLHKAIKVAPLKLKEVA